VLTALREKQLAKLSTRFIDDGLLQIQDKLNIKRKTTTKVARHSYATIMKRAGAGIEFIKESWGIQPPRQQKIIGLVLKMA
jgi:site-specific recombinase XerD